MARAMIWLDRAKQDPEAVVEALLAMQAPDEARLAAFALQRAGHGEALDRGTRASSPLVRAAVVDVLATAGRPATLEVRLAEEPEGWLRVRLAAALARDPRRLPALIAHADPGVRVVALDAARRADRVEPGLDEAADEAAREATPALAWLGCVLLRTLEDPAGIDALERACRHPDPFVAVQAARGLRLHGLSAPVEIRGLDEAVPVDLDGVRALDDQDPADVRIAALALLHSTDDHALQAAIGRLAAAPEALPGAGSLGLDAVKDDLALSAIVAGCAHPLPAIQRIATRALDGHAGPAVWQAYTDRMDAESDPEERARVAWTVARRREHAALPLLVAWADDPDPVVVHAAVEGLRARVRKTARSRTDAVREVLLRRLQDAEDATRALAAEALGRFKDDAVRAALHQALDDAAIAETARRSLQRLG